MAQAVKQSALDSGSSHDLGIHETEVTSGSGLYADNMVTA